jgi:hypothetical protein
MINGLGKDVEALQAENKSLVKTIVLVGEVADNNTKEINKTVNIVNGLPENEIFIKAVLENVVKNLPQVVVETENDLESAIEAANTAISEVAEAVGELEPEPLTFDQVEALINAQIEKDNAEEDKYNTLVAETISNLETANGVNAVISAIVKPSHELVVGGEKMSVDEFKALVKSEIYEGFVKAGYGKMVDGEFVLKRAFFGAEILEGDEDRYKPVSSFK